MFTYTNNATFNTFFILPKQPHFQTACFSKRFMDAGKFKLQLEKRLSAGFTCTKDVIHYSLLFLFKKCQRFVMIWDSTTFVTHEGINLYLCIFLIFSFNSWYTCNTILDSLTLQKMGGWKHFESRLTGLPSPGTVPCRGGKTCCPYYP